MQMNADFREMELILNLHVSSIDRLAKSEGAFQWEFCELIYLSKTVRVVSFLPL